jgi:hypothetical protein
MHTTHASILRAWFENIAQQMPWQLPSTCHIHVHTQRFGFITTHTHTHTHTNPYHMECIGFLPGLKSTTTAKFLPWKSVIIALMHTHGEWMCGPLTETHLWLFMLLSIKQKSWQQNAIMNTYRAHAEQWVGDIIQFSYFYYHTITVWISTKWHAIANT